MMKRLMNNVNELVKQELKLANENYPPFNSGHEGYAVLLEEVEEADCEMVMVKSSLNYVWCSVKVEEADCEMVMVKASLNYVWCSVKNDIQIIPVEDVKNYAMRLACEAIQVAAMCDKFIDFKDSKETK